ncbi:hypothetical protein [Natrinema sp. HArc-T2]|uniref:hypothetical protein n=1 Tax=Natrinema sp. HArc-T2 TaxID=3242701 RepID=UPI00359D2C2B
MEQLDDRILEHLHEEEWSSVTVMNSRPEFRASKARLRERCQMLASAELIEPLHRDMYEITTWGVLYLEGELDADHQPEPSPQTLGK